MSRKRELTPYGKEVKHRLIELNMTQVELAEQVGTSKQYLGKNSIWRAVWYDVS